MITADIQTLEPGAIVELYVLDLTPFGGPLYRFHSGTNSLQQNVVWQGNTYQPWPIQVTGFEFTGQGQLPRPQLTIANVLGTISALILQYGEPLGAKLTRHRTFAKYLDAVNFTGGANPTADATAAFADDIYYIDRRAGESKDYVTFELAAAFDIAGIQLPLRQIVQNSCPWQYRGTECGYTGGPVADINDMPTASSTVDACGKRLTSCQLRFGQYAVLPFGGFPAAGLVQ